MSKVFKNTSIYTIGNILPQAANFLFLPIYTRYLTPSDYGIVASMNVLQAILAVFFSLCMERSVFRLYYDYDSKEDRTKFLGTISISIFIISTICLLLIVSLRSIVQKIFVSIDFYPFYLYAILTCYTLVFSYVPKIYLMLKEKATIYVLLSLLQFFANSGLILFFIICRGEGAAGMLKGKLFGAIILMPIVIILAIKYFTFRFDFAMFKSSFSFSWPSIPTMLSSWILYLSDRIFIERYFSMSEVGIYSLGCKIASVGVILFSAFTMAYDPLFYKLANENIQDYSRKLIRRYNNIFIYIVIIISFLIAFFSKEVFYLFMDSKYKQAYIFTILISLAYLIHNIVTISGKFISQSKKVKQGMAIDMSTAGLNIILNFSLIPHFGAYGAAYATIISFAFAFIVYYFYTKKNCYFIPYNWSQIIPLFGILLFVFVLFQFVLNFDIVTSLIIKMFLVGVMGLFFIKKYYSQVRVIFSRE